MLSRQKSSYSEHRCANHRSRMLITNKCLIIDLVPSLKRRINGARRQFNVNNKAPKLKLLFSPYLSWLTHKPPVRLQPAIQLIDSVRWLAGAGVFLSASFLFNLPTLKAARDWRYVIFCGKRRQGSLRCDKKGICKQFRKLFSFGERKQDDVKWYFAMYGLRSWLEWSDNRRFVSWILWCGIVKPRDKKALFYDPETDVKKLIWWNILYYNSFWSQEKISGKVWKVNFGGSCRMI